MDAPGPSPVRRVTQKLKRTLRHEVERPDVGLRVIILWKCVKAAMMLLVGIGAFAAIHRDLHEIGLTVVYWLNLEPANETVGRVLEKLTGLTTLRRAEIGAGSLGVACFLLVEAWGLHKRRTWAEWLTIGATSLFIPLEVYELLHKRSAGKGLVLVANVAIVLYLMRHNFLFVPGPIGRWLHAHLGKERHAPGNPADPADVGPR